jgi:CMP-N-acetylneuraminic acid synthetase
MKEFCGLPLFYWSVIQSLSSHLIDKTYVSTDSARIASDAEGLGAEVIWRYNEQPDVSAGGTVHDAVLELWERGEEFDMFMDLLPTGPTRKPDDLDNMIKMYYDTGCDCSIATLVPATEMTVYENVGENRAKGIFSSKENGQYLGCRGSESCQNTEWFMQSDKEYKYMTNAEHALLSMEEAQMAAGINAQQYYPVEIWQQPDIDYQDEFEWLEVIMEHYILKGRGRKVYDDYKMESTRETVAEKTADLQRPGC